jgi:hypothetical protein
MRCIDHAGTECIVSGEPRTYDRPERVQLEGGVLSERVLPRNRLGDWYASLLFTRRARLIICVCERSLLPVFVEARAPSSFIPPLPTLSLSPFLMPTATAMLVPMEPALFNPPKHKQPSSGPTFAQKRL